MLNPWLAVPDAPPFVLGEDRERIDNFNRTASAAARIALDLLPEPFQGSHDAPVVLLGLNPGLSTQDAAIHSDPVFARRLRATLAHEEAPFPFYLLHPEVQGPGRRWWEGKLSSLLAVAPRETVARRLLSIEYFPYHSVRFGQHRLRLPSQEYGFFLAREAVMRNAVVILMRSHQLWYEAVPELKMHRRLFTLRSVQNIVISRNNCPSGFDAVLAALDGGPVPGRG